MAGYDYTPAATASAAKLQTAMGGAVNGQRFAGLGTNAMLGLSASIAGYDYTPAAATSAAKLQSAMGGMVNSQRFAGLGTNAMQGISLSMSNYDFTPAAATSAAKLQTTMRGAVNSERFAALGNSAMQGLSQSMTHYDYSGAVARSALRLQSTMKSAVNGEHFATFGTSAMRGLSASMAGYNMNPTGCAVGTHVRSALAASINSTSLRGIELNAMNGLTAGINAGRSGVVSAMRSAARDAINAAKAELKIHSPSGVFRDEVGRMSMKGFGEGAVLESKKQARTIKNAMRYLTDAAQEDAVAFSHTDNRRTINQQSSVNLTGNTFYIRNEEDIQSLAVEIATLIRRQQRGQGLR